ncbi:sugar transferase [Solirubrobacter taibaiensis]|nr:sugar transferase [Solirubrobacter taibaiensis]
MSAQTIDRGLGRSPDVERAAARLAQPHARAALAVKRLADVVLALAMLVALVPLFLAVLLLLGFAGEGMIERRQRLGRDGRTLTLVRFRALPGGAVGRWLERAGARELPLLLTVLRGRMSFVGPRPVAPGGDYTGPRRLLAPGLIGPDSDSADAYVEQWTLRSDARLLAGRRAAHHSVSNSSS